MKSNRIITITSGLIRRNFLEDFPQHLLMDVNDEYQLVISSQELSLVYELNPLRSNTDLSYIVPTCEVRIPFKIYNNSHVKIDWGDRKHIH